MGLTMDAATYARDAAGRAKLKADFNGDIQALINVCNGSKYTDMVRFIRNNWVGADADDFIADINKTRNQLISKLKTLTTVFNNAIDADAKQFASFQSKNVK